MKIKVKESRDWYHLYLNDESIAYDEWKAIIKRVEALFKIAGVDFPIILKEEVCNLKFKKGKVELEIEGC